MIRRRVSTGTASTSPDSAIPGTQEHPESGEEVQLTEKPPRAMGGDDASFVVGIEQDLHPPREDDVEVVARVPCPEQVAARFDPSACTQRLEEGDLGGIEGRD